MHGKPPVAADKYGNQVVFEFLDYSLRCAEASGSVAWCIRGSGDFCSEGARVACGGHGICMHTWGRGRGVNTPQAEVGVPVSVEVNTALVHDEDIRTKEYDSAVDVC